MLQKKSNALDQLTIMLIYKELKSFAFTNRGTTILTPSTVSSPCTDGDDLRNVSLG